MQVNQDQMSNAVSQQDWTMPSESFCGMCLIICMQKEIDYQGDNAILSDMVPVFQRKVPSIYMYKANDETLL